MFMFLRNHISQHERGLRFVRGDFKRLMAPGTTWKPIFGKLRRIKTEVVSTLDFAFEHEMLDILVKVPDLHDALHIADLSDTQRALVWRDGRLACILGPGRHAFWKDPYAVQIEVFELGDDPRLEHSKIDAIAGFEGAARWLSTIDVAPQEEVILFRDAEAVARLQAGRYVTWRTSRPIVVKRSDLRESIADIAGQEIMTRDKVTLRVNLVVASRVTDALKAQSVVSDASAAIYREAQLALREAVGTRTLDELLSDKDAVGAEIRGALTKRASDFGMEVCRVGLRDVILPGDMKTILNQVIAAKKQAEANVIKRREETAAARSQANTAKLLEDNPALARIKELEMLQEILAGADVRFVLGQGDLSGQVRALTGGDARAAD